MLVNLSPLERALERISIPYLWQLFNLPGNPGPSCRSPFREDRHPSFSIYADDQRWYDFTTGDGGNAADFVAKALNLSREDGCRKLIEIAGTRSSGSARANPKPRPIAAKYDPLLDKEKARQRRSWPAFETPSDVEIVMIARQRDLSPEALKIAVERGLLFCTTWHGRRAWIVTDRTRLAAQVRRLDGLDWDCGKAQSLLGSIGSWPVGIREAQAFPAIALVEGGPDLLAAFHLAWIETSTPETLALGKGVDVLGNLGVVAMLGSAADIADAAVPLFAGKRVRIFAHDDWSGVAGLGKWTSALKAAGASVDAFGFRGFHQSDGSEVNDLNDFVRLDYDEWEAKRSLVESVFEFVPTAPLREPKHEGLL